MLSATTVCCTVCQFNVQASVYPFIYRSLPFSEYLSHLLRFYFPSGFYQKSFHGHSHSYCNNDSFFPFTVLSTSYLFHPLLSLSALPSAAPGCGECLAFGGRQASVCVSEITQLKSRTWQITAAIQKWTITSKKIKNY